jgi:hypothetical protein
MPRRTFATLLAETREPWKSLPLARAVAWLCARRDATQPQHKIIRSGRRLRCLVEKLLTHNKALGEGIHNLSRSEPANEDLSGLHQMSTDDHGV